MSMGVSVSQNQGQNTNRNDKIHTITRLFARLVLLAYVCVVSSLILIIASALIYGILITVFDTKHGYFFDIFLWTSVFVDNLINITCMSLQYENYGYFELIYNHCCHPCERYVKLLNQRPEISMVGQASEESQDGGA